MQPCSDDLSLVLLLKLSGDSEMCQLFDKLCTMRESIVGRENKLSEKIKKYGEELQKNKR